MIDLRYARPARFGGAALLLMSALGAPIVAEGQTATRDSAARRIESVVVRGARTPSVTGGASTVTIRPDSLPIPSLPSPSLELILRQTPFVLVRQNSRGEIELSVRGSDSRQATVLLDGLPLTLGWDHRSDPSLLPTTGVEQITLVRGLASLLGGPNTLGGIISLDLNAAPRGGQRRMRSLMLGTGIDQYGARVLSGFGTLPYQLNGGMLQVRGGASYHQRDGVALSRNGGGGDGTTGGAADPGSIRDGALRTNTDLRQLDGFLGMRFDTRGGAHLAFTATAYEAERGVAPEQHIAAPRFWRYPAAARQLGILSAGSGVRRTPLGFATLEVSAGMNRGDVEIANYLNSRYDSITTRELGVEQARTVRAVATHTLPGSSTLRLGGTAGRVVYDETLDAQRATASATRYEQSLSSVGVEVEVPMGGRMLVSGGAVRDAAATPNAGGRVPLAEQSLPGWRLGTTIATSDEVRLHASASRRARFPSLRELYSGALNRFDPNPDLRPERLLGFEAGATFTPTSVSASSLQLQAVAFHHALDDAVVRITLPNRKFRRINRDQLRTTGTELLAAWAPTGASGVSVNADVVAQRVRVMDQTLGPAAEERRAEHQPELRGSLHVSTPFALGTRASVSGRYTGRQFCQHPDLGRRVELGGQTVADAAMSRSWLMRRAGLLQRLRTVLAVDNITDATVYDQCGLPQQGRTIRLGVEIR